MSNSVDSDKKHQTEGHPMDRRHTTLVFDVPSITPRTAEDKLRAVRLAIEDSIQNRMTTLKNECQTIGNDMEALVMRLQDEGHEAELTDIKSARWYRTAAQLEVLKRLYKAFCKITGADEGVVEMPTEEIDSGAVSLRGVLGTPTDEIDD